ncbi:MAG TPA: aconitase/3-isopropylmalate dehydratase large subunit family protein [Gemmatimonadaceae bacterium]|jgi:3-isopropylmalate/(R)-2-methylmalate dehydratase large subunit
MSSAKTVSEKILSEHASRDSHAGDVVVCNVDLVLGTDASAPMAIDYFERMNGKRVFDPARVMFALDHYAPPSTAKTAGFHDRVRAFARQHGIEVHDVGAGISHQIAVEQGRVVAGDLVIGADSHTVTAGALGAFATGVGSSDIAAAMIMGEIWLRVPDTIRIDITGERPKGLTAKDIALALVAELGAEGANYQTLELHGDALGALSLEERLVVSNLAVEAGAKAAIFPHDDATAAYLAGRTDRQPGAVESDPGARYARTLVVDLSRAKRVVALPHAPENVVALEEAIGTPIHMVFLGTCTGGRVSDFHAALAVLERGGSRVAPGVQLVVTPASREVYSRLLEDGTLAKLAAMGAVITTPGCGACCGTSGAIPGDGVNVLSTANRNFKARMGNATASIYLASPEACAAAAVTGRITDPASIG